MKDDTPILYVFVRTDMPSMTPGKAQAHSGHAANAFVHKHIVQRLKNGLTGIALDSNVVKWMNSTDQGFGTQINLKGDWHKVVAAHFNATWHRHLGIITDIVSDPTYPYIVDDEVLKLIPRHLHTAEPIKLENGKFLCHRRESTAIYFFGTKEQLKPFVGEFPLHP